MNRLIYGTALAAIAVAAPMAAQAQQLPPSAVAVVNRNQIAAQCTPCAAAATQLQQQGQQYQAREQQLLGPLQTEQQAIQAALTALPQGGQPDQALQNRIRAFENNREAAGQELGRAQQTLQRNQNYVISQILQRMGPLINQVAQQRGASIALDSTDTLFSTPQLDLTQAVLALMNQNAAPFVTVAPPPQQQPAAAPAAQQPAQPNRPRPQGR